MASTNKTTHYDLPQWIGTDKPTFLGDMNQAYEDIDTAIYNAATAASNAASAAGSAQSAAATAQSAAESAGSTASAANTLATTANTNAVSALNAIGSTPLQTTAQTLTAAVNEVLHDIPDDATDIPYDNQTSGLSASTVQGAIDEIAQGGGGVGEWTLLGSVNAPASSGGSPSTQSVTVPATAKELLITMTNASGVVFGSTILPDTTHDGRFNYPRVTAANTISDLVQVEYDATNSTLSVLWPFGSVLSDVVGNLYYR